MFRQALLLASLGALGCERSLFGVAESDAAVTVPDAAPFFPDGNWPDATGPFCTKGEERSCYSGPPGTAGQGVCHEGHQECLLHDDVTSEWGPCEDEVTPTEDACENGLDEDCNGSVDDGPGCLPDAAQPDAAQPDAAQPDAAQPDAAQPDAAQPPDAGPADAAPIDAAGPDAAQCADGDMSACGTDVGACVSGSRTCTGGVWGPCEGATGPAGEECDAIDNDCDGLIDEVCGGCGWTATWGGTSSDFANGLAVTGDGAILVTGQFSETSDFDPGPAEDLRESAGNWDAFLAKLGPDGAVLWARTWGDAWYEIPYDVAAAPDGSAYVTGFFYLGTDLDPGTATDSRLAVGMWDIFLTKLNSAGGYEWGASWGRAGTQSWGSGVAVAPDDGTVLMVGRYGGSAVAEAFLKSLSSEGTELWEKVWGGGTGSAAASNVAIDPSGYVYVSGTFDGTVDFDPGPGEDMRTATGGADVFLSRFTRDGTWIWTATWGGLEDDWGGPVVAGADGSASVSGSFHGYVDFDPGPDVAGQMAAGGLDGYVTTLDSTGTHRWTRTWGAADWHDSVSGIGGAPDGSLRVARAVYGTPREVFVTKLAATGADEWTEAYGDSGGVVDGPRCAVATDGSAVLAGMFFGTVDFDPGPGIDPRVSSGAADVYVTKLCVEPAVRLGENCDTVLVVSEPGTVTLDTCDFVADIDSSCGDPASPDIIVGFEVTAPVNVAISVDGPWVADVSLREGPDCPGVLQGCISGLTGGGVALTGWDVPGPKQIIVQGATATDCGPVTITLGW